MVIYMDLDYDYHVCIRDNRSPESMPVRIASFVVGADARTYARQYQPSTLTMAGVLEAFVVDKQGNEVLQ